jgi:hypothetical protein
MGRERKINSDNVAVGRDWLSRSHLIARLLRIAAALVIALATLEVASRVDDAIRYNAPLMGEYSSEILFTYDDESIRHNVPLAQYEKWRNNSLGFRGPEISTAKPSGKMRIICMGTSETYGLYESENGEWPAQLRASLREYSRAEIVNGATVGIRFEDYVHYLQKYVFKYQPDLVIVFINPIAYSRNRIRSLSDADPGAGGIKSRSRSSPRSGIEVLGTSRLIPKLTQLVKQNTPQVFLRSCKIWSLRREVERAEESHLRGRHPIEEVPDDVVVAFQEDVANFADEVAKNGIRCIFCTYPSLITEDNLQRYLEIFLEDRVALPEFSFNWMIDAGRQLNGVLRKLAASGKISVLDCDMAVPKTTSYFADNSHYTDDGAARVAACVHSFLIEQFGLR